MNQSAAEGTSELSMDSPAHMRRAILFQHATADAYAVPISNQQLLQSLIREILSGDIAVRIYRVDAYVFVISLQELEIGNDVNVIRLRRRKNQFFSYEISPPAKRTNDQVSRIHILQQGSITEYTITRESEVYLADLVDVTRFALDAIEITPVVLHDDIPAKGFDARKELAGVTGGSGRQSVWGKATSASRESLPTRMLYLARVFVAGMIARVLNQIVRDLRPGSNVTKFASSRHEQRHKELHERADKVQNFFQKITQPLFRKLLHSKLTSGYQRFRDLYDNGQFEEAMKHASPLSMSQTGNHAPFGFKSLFDGIRTFLPDAPLTRSAGVVEITASDFKHLRTMYEAMVSELMKQGKHEKAAYVIADLLDDPDRAVQLLLDNSRFDLAVRLAESRETSLAVKVRACLAIDDIPRACGWAVSGGMQSFELIVHTLSMLKYDDAVIDAFVYAYSEAAYERGARHAAIDALWKRESTRAQSLPILEEVFTATNATRCIDICRIVRLLHDVDPLRSESVLMHYCTAAPELLYELLALFKPMYVQSMSDMIARAVRHTMPHIPFLASKWRALQQHLYFMGIRTLAADLNNVKVPEQEDETDDMQEVASFTYNARYDVGSVAVLDVSPISDSLFLCALGSEGCVVLNASGKIIRRIQRPTTQIVRDDEGVCDLLVEKTGRTARIAMYDRVHGRVEEWATILCDTIPDQWNGWSLIVLDDDRIRCLAVGGRTVREITQWYDDELIPLRIDVQMNAYFIVCMSKKDRRRGELWCIHRQQQRMYRRLEFTTEEPINASIIVYQYVMWHLVEGTLVAGNALLRSYTFRPVEDVKTKTVSIHADEPNHLRVTSAPLVRSSNGHVLFTYSSESQLVVDCIPNIYNEAVCRVVLGPSNLVQATARIVGQFFCVCTKDGRVIVINMYTGLPICEAVL